MSCEEIVVQPWLHGSWQMGVKECWIVETKGRNWGCLWSEGSESGSSSRSRSVSGSVSGSESMSSKAGLWAKCSGGRWVGLPSDEVRRRGRHERIGDEVGRMLGVGIIFVCH